MLVRLSILLALCLTACGPRGPQEYAVEGRAMGTTYTVKFIAQPLDSARTQEIADAVFAVIDDVNAKMSTYLEESELSRFNQLEADAAFEVSPDTMTVLGEAARIGAISGGSYDVTVGPVVNLWGFGPGGRANDISEGTIRSLLESVGWDKIEIDEEALTLRKLRPGVYVDLSSIAKGYAVDRVAVVLDDLGYVDYLIEIGGELRARGLNVDGETWRVAVERPVENERAIERVLSLDSLAMATSGDYRNYYDADGQRISHTIDPRTGRPVRSRVAAVTVIHPSCMTADGWATALTAMGEEEGFALADREGLEALFQLRQDDGDFQQRPTTAFVRRFGEMTR